MHKISRRQLYFFLACIAPVGKLVILPAHLAQYAGNDLVIPALLNYLFQTALVFCVLLLAKRGMSFYELIANTLGKVVGKIVMLIFGAFLLYAALLPLLEQQIFVQGTFYDTLPSVVAFSPFFVFGAYLCSKPLASQGRVWDILAPVAIVGILGVLVFSVMTADFGSLLPIGGSGLKNIAKSTAFSISWFYDSALLMLFLGKFDYEKGTAWKGALLYFIGGLVVLFFLATFYAIFQGTSVNQLFAFTETSKYFSAITVLGRVDYLFIYALALVMIFYVALPLQACVECILQAFGRKEYLPTLLSVGINLLFILFMFFFDYRFGEAMRVVSQTVFWIFPIFTAAVPLLCFLLRRNRRERS